MKTVEIKSQIEASGFQKGSLYVHKDEPTLIVLCTRSSPTMLIGVAVSHYISIENVGHYCDNGWGSGPDVWKEFHGEITLKN